MSDGGVIEKRVYRWWHPDVPWGFRFSMRDLVALCLCGGIAVVGYSYVGALAFLPILVAAHFLLFCNTFRVGGEIELTWIGTFLVNALVWSLLGKFSVPRIFLTQTPVTLGLIAVALRSRGYHGAGYGWINPKGYRRGAELEGWLGVRLLLRLGFPDKWIVLLTGKSPEKLLSADREKG